MFTKEMEKPPERERLIILGGALAALIAPTIVLTLAGSSLAKPERVDCSASPVDPPIWTIESILNQSGFNWQPGERGGVTGIWTFGQFVRRGRCLIAINGNIYNPWPGPLNSIFQTALRPGHFFQILNPSGGLWYSFQVPF